MDKTEKIYGFAIVTTVTLSQSEHIRTKRGFISPLILLHFSTVFVALRTKLLYFYCKHDSLRLVYF